jgi:hypothetical protein
MKTPDEMEAVHAEHVVDLVGNITRYVPLHEGAVTANPSATESAVGILLKAIELLTKDLSTERRKALILGWAE